MLLPGADAGAAARRAEQLRSKVEALVVRYVEKNLPRITVSIGVSAFPEAGDNPQVVLKAADEALYRAKKAAETGSSCRAWPPSIRRIPQPTLLRCSARWLPASTFPLKKRANRLHHLLTLLRT